MNHSTDQADVRRETDTDKPLRRDIRMLGFELGQVIKRYGGQELFDLVERVRYLSKQRRVGDDGAEQTLRDDIASLSLSQLDDLIRALSCFFHLANLAEDRHRVRVLRDRERKLYPANRRESIGAAIDALKDMEFSATQVQAMLDQLQVELVFTAHPTEAKRRTVRNTLTRIREDLIELDRPDGLPRERARSLARIKSDLDCLWETDSHQPRKPTVLEEVRRGLFIADTLWTIVPEIYRTMRQALTRSYPEQNFRLPVFLHFGSWIGGDRDGNPFVTPAVTEETLMLLRGTAMRKHQESARRLSSILSVSSRRHTMSAAIKRALADARNRWPKTAKRIDKVNPNETYRQWLAVIRYRLEQTASVKLDQADTPGAGAYANASELAADLHLVGDSLRANGHTDLADGELQDWLECVRVFGFHQARLDVREDSTLLQDAIAELTKHMGLVDNYADRPEPERQQLLSAPITAESAAKLQGVELSETTAKTVGLFRLLQQCAVTFGREALGAAVVSMTRQPSDALATMWLGRLGAQLIGRTDGYAAMPVVPLFETIDDLRQSRKTLAAIFKAPGYRKHIEATGQPQICMVGYSDSTKDGGYLAANWELDRAQRQLAELADAEDIPLMIFHGRGGALGRGGGPAARSILCLPSQSVGGRIRMTEQGEVVAERYDDPQIAYRHIEQVTWATLLVSATGEDEAPANWRKLLNDVADQTVDIYRRLREDDGFVHYFEHATPINGIEELPIGSRPARRSTQRSLSTLRAIPYTFAWTQSRHLITAFYGLGAGFADVSEQQWTQLREMYRQWPFFKALIDNAELALAKADMPIAAAYAAMVDDEAIGQRLLTQIRDEYDLAKSVVCRITGRANLLDNTPWLQRSIQVRNPYIDPLNFIQIELIKRKQAAEAKQDEAGAAAIAQVLRSSIQGIAAGMRTTG